MCLKVLVLGGTIFARNRGVAALTKGCILSLRKNFINPKITLLHTFVESFYPIKTTNLEENVRIVMDTEERVIRIILRAVVRVFIAMLWRFLRFIHVNADFLLKRDKVLREYKNADIVINLCYGDTFAYKKEFYFKLLFFILWQQSLTAVLLKKPLFFFPQSIGPFQSSLSRILAKFVLNRCQVIMTREELSKQYLLKMGIKAPIYVVPDLSFAVKPTPDHRVYEILFEENIEEEHPLAGIAIRENMYKYLDIMSAIVNYLTSKMKVKVIFIPHTSISDLHTHLGCCDPRLLARKIIKRIECKELVNSIDGEYTVEELRGIIGKCDLFIGAYMHANTSALSTYVPIVAISYSHKTEGIMNLVGLGEFVLPLKDLSIPYALNKIEKAFYNRDRLRHALRRKIPVLREKAMKTGEIVKIWLQKSIQQLLNGVY